MTCEDDAAEEEHAVSAVHSRLDAALSSCQHRQVALCNQTEPNQGTLVNFSAGFLGCHSLP